MSAVRFLLLAIVAGLLLWYVVLPALDEPGIRGPAGDAVESVIDEQPEAHDDWTPEERAVWREQVNQRLYGR